MRARRSAMTGITDLRWQKPFASRYTYINHLKIFPNPQGTSRPRYFPKRAFPCRTGTSSFSLSLSPNRQTRWWPRPPQPLLSMADLRAHAQRRPPSRWRPRAECACAEGSPQRPRRCTLSLRARAEEPYRCPLPLCYI